MYSVPSPTHCYADQYFHKEQCCRKCSPGQKVKEHCLVGKPNTTKCQDCTKGTYQPESNGEMYCRHCDRQIKSNRKILSNCTKLHNKKYGDCVKGFFYKEGLDDCVKCTWCPIGVGVEQECTKTTDTKCSKAKCPLVSSIKVKPANNGYHCNRHTVFRFILLQSQTFPPSFPYFLCTKRKTNDGKIIKLP